MATAQFGLRRCSRLGARIIAVEPQPVLVMVLKLFYGLCADVAIETAAVGHTAGRRGFEEVVLQGLTHAVKAL